MVIKSSTNRFCIILDHFQPFHVGSSFKSASKKSASVETTFTSGVCLKTKGHHVVSKNVDICDAYDTLNAALAKDLPTDRFGRSAIFGKGGLRLHDMSERSVHMIFLSWIVFF